jgi:hypothetical protein
LDREGDLGKLSLGVMEEREYESQPLLEVEESFI